MKFSLLFSAGADERKTFLLNDDVTENLSVKKTVEGFSHDEKKNDYFMSVLAHLPADMEDSIYRQEILADFIAFPDLFSQLKTIFQRYDKIKSDWIELRSGVGNPESKNPEAMLDYVFGSLKVTSIFPKTIVSFFESLRDLISKYDIKSKGLKNILEYCSGMLENDSMSELVRISGLFRYKNAEDYDFSVILSLDSSLEICNAELCGIEEKKKEKKPIIDISKIPLLKKLSKEDKPVSCPEQTTDTVRRAVIESLIAADNSITEITSGVYESLYGFGEQMDFYDVALEYSSFVSSSGMPLCFPHLSAEEEDRIEFDSLADLFLLSGGMSADKIVTNSISFTKGDRLVLIKGLNGSGKTTFLRAVATAQLFAQSGLPVSAKEAKFSMRSGVFTHFSSAEEEFGQNDSAGRFEGEVRKMASIVNDASAGSLVILNETFQTTAFAEGSEGMSGIIKYLIRIKNCKIIFVTHLTALFDEFYGDEVRKMKTITSDTDESTPYVLKDIN